MKTPRYIIFHSSALGMSFQFQYVHIYLEFVCCDATQIHHYLKILGFHCVHQSKNYRHKILNKVWVSNFSLLCSVFLLLATLTFITIDIVIIIRWKYLSLFAQSTTAHSIEERLTRYEIGEASARRNVNNKKRTRISLSKQFGRRVSSSGVDEFLIASPTEITIFFTSFRSNSLLITSSSANIRQVYFGISGPSFLFLYPLNSQFTVAVVQNSNLRCQRTLKGLQIDFLCENVNCLC